MGDGDVIWTWIAHTWIIHYLHTMRTQYELLYYLNYISFRAVFNIIRKSTRDRVLTVRSSRRGLSILRKVRFISPTTVRYVVAYQEDEKLKYWTMMCMREILAARLH